MLRSPDNEFSRFLDFLKYPKPNNWGESTVSRSFTWLTVCRAPQVPILSDVGDEGRTDVTTIAEGDSEKEGG